MRREILQLGAVATVVLLFGGGAAVATGTLPLHSVGFNNLKPNLQRLVTKMQRRAKMPVGIHGKQGEAGPAGPEGRAGKSAPELPGKAEPPETPFDVAVSTVTATSAILETTIGPFDGSGVWYQFQLAHSLDGLRSEVSCPENSVPEVQCLGALASSGEEGFIRQPGDLPTEPLLPEDGQRRIRLQINGLSPATEYHYRLLVVDRIQTVDTIEWYAPPRIGPTRSFETAAGWTCPSGGC